MSQETDHTNIDMVLTGELCPVLAYSVDFSAKKVGLIVIWT